MPFRSISEKSQQLWRLLSGKRWLLSTDHTSAFRAYKLGGARCSYNQIRVTLQELGGIKQLTVHEAHQEGDHLLDEAHKVDPCA